MFLSDGAVAVCWANRVLRTVGVSAYPKPEEHQTMSLVGPIMANRPLSLHSRLGSGGRSYADGDKDTKIDSDGRPSSHGYLAASGGCNA
jgi:hypothetical protein